VIKTSAEKVVAGMSCSEVLAVLSDYLDDELPPAGRLRVEEHLRGCEVCARFGGEFRTTVHALKVHLARADTLPEGLLGRLRTLLDQER